MEIFYFLLFWGEAAGEITEKRFLSKKKSLEIEEEKRRAEAELFSKSG